MKIHKNRQKRRVTPRQVAAGRDNLLQYRRRVDGAPALRHGIHAAIKGTNLLPAGCEDIPALVDEMSAQMAADLGGDLTAAQRSILASQRLCLTVIELATRYLRTQGLLDKRGRPHPLLATCTSFANCLRHNALALGLERRARKVGPQNLEEHLAQIAEKESQNETHTAEN